MAMLKMKSIRELNEKDLRDRIVQMKTELSKLKTVEKSNTHQQGKSLPLLTHRKAATSVVPIHFLELTSLPPSCSQPALSKPAHQASSITC